MQRDEFPEATKRVVAARVAYRCSNPDCRAPTAGPQLETGKTLNVGVAAHVSAAAPEGPRFASLGWFHMTMAALIALIAGLIMFLSFALIASQMVLAVSEAYVGIGGGVLLLGFSGSRWTIKFAEGFLGWLLGVAVKLFFLYLLVGVGLTITAG